LTCVQDEGEFTTLITKNILYSIIFLVGFVAVSLWSFWFITRPPKVYSGYTPELFSLPHEDVRLKTEDGIDIAAWFIPSPRTQAPTLLFLHGYPAEKGDLLSIVKEFHKEFDIFMIDFRSFGKSGGSSTTLGKKEQLDLKTALDELERRGKTNIGVFGFSLGGAVALLSAPDDQRIKAIVTYAAFADLKLLGYETYKNLWILKYPLVELLSFWMRLFQQHDVAKESPRVAAQKITIPVFLIHSKSDEQISFRHAELLRASLSRNSKAEFYFIESALHGELPPDFFSRVRDFLSRTL